MTRLITVTQAHNKEALLVNIDSIKKVTIIDYSPESNAKIEFNNGDTIDVTETLNTIKTICNS